ncbi:MAG: hypothetical protein ACLQPH_12830 [Acidimicrobiales bacterium]
MATRPNHDDQGDGAGPRSDPDSGRPSGKPGWSDRARATAAPRSPGSARPTKWSIDRLDAQEKRFSIAASVAAVFLGTLIYFVETDNKHFHLTKGQFTPQTTLVVGLVAGAALLGSTFIGRRALVGFVSLFTFLAFSSTSFVVGLPFLLLAGLLLYRSYKIQKETSAQLRAERAAGSTARAGTAGGASDRPGRAGRQAPAGKATGKASAKGSVSGSAAPEANKRYTPKRPPRPAPKPSRRDRKAAKASD